MNVSADVRKLNPHLPGSALKRARLKDERKPDPKRFENKLAEQLKERGVDQPLRDVTFCIHGRRWRVDFMWTEQRVVAEVDGGTWSQGRHTRGAGFKEDCIKLNHASREGWKVLRFTTDMVTDGTAAEFIKETLDEVGTGKMAW